METLAALNTALLAWLCCITAYMLYRDTRPVKFTIKREELKAVLEEGNVPQRVKDCRRKGEGIIVERPASKEAIEFIERMRENKPEEHHKPPAQSLGGKWREPITPNALRDFYGGNPPAKPFGGIRLDLYPPERAKGITEEKEADDQLTTQAQREYDQHDKWIS